MVRTLLALPLLASLLLAAPLRAEDAPLFRGWPERAPLLQPQHRELLHDAATLDTGVLGVGASLGFPYVTVETGVGVSEAWDARLSVRALYGIMSQVGVSVRTRVHGERGGFAIAPRLDLERAFYGRDRAGVTLAGTRDFAIHPGVVLSVRSVQDTCFFADLGVQLALDFDPPTEPLGGAPPAVALVTNLPLHFGMELPVSRHFDFFSVLGLDVRVGRRLGITGEPPVLPFLLVGLSLSA